MNLMNDLLDLSSLESMDIIQKEKVDTHDATKKIVNQLWAGFASKDQKVDFQINAKTVNADPGRLDQVVVNLLDNANKYTPPGGTITVLWDEGGDDTILTVRDTGPGIPLEHQPRLFERFYRVDKGRSRAEGGTGLGLAIVKHIVQRHGGTVTVESKIGRGAQFICRFPKS